MKVRFPDKEEFLKLFRGLPSIFKMRRRKKHIEMDCPMGYEISREFHRLKTREFANIFRAINVEGGKKIWRSDKIILEPRKDALLAIRVAPSELKLIKKAAKNIGEKFPDYCRAAIFTRMTRDLGI